MRFSFPSPIRKFSSAFTLVELLVSIAILMVLMTVILGLTGTVSGLWRNTASKMQAFGDARAALGIIGGTLEQAVLNPYWNYDTLPDPKSYEKYSELQFLSLPMSRLGTSYDPAVYPTCGLFFQAPTGMTWNRKAYGVMPTLLNAYGYFVEFGNDTDDRPSFLPPSYGAKYRFRLKQWKLPSEEFKLYDKTAGEAGKSYLGEASLNWIDLQTVKPRTIAENVIAFVVMPKDSFAGAPTGRPMTDDYQYNSRTDGTNGIALAQKHQLPPEVELVLVAVDEDSANRLQGNSSVPPKLVKNGLFEDSTKLEENLKTLQEDLDGMRVRYVVLRSTVSIRGK